MNSWFECKIKTAQTLEGGATKMVTNLYLVNALTFTEAETRIIKEVSPYCNGHLEVMDLKRAKYSEMFPSDADDADKWYKVKYKIITVDEKSQKEKESTVLNLVQASDINNAIKRFNEEMRHSVIDYRIENVTDTKILDVFHYEAVVSKEQKED